MKKEEISKIIESTLLSGEKIPGLFDLPKILALKTKLQSSQSVEEVQTIIVQHRELITKAFGLGEDKIDAAIEKIKALESQGT
jgi:hypothetical protein